MDRNDVMRGGGHPIAVGPAGDVVPDGPPGGVLHRDPFSLSPLAQRRLLFVGEPQGHGHGLEWYHLDTTNHTFDGEGPVVAVLSVLGSAPGE